MALWAWSALILLGQRVCCFSPRVPVSDVGACVVSFGNANGTGALSPFPLKNYLLPFC